MQHTYILTDTITMRLIGTGDEAALFSVIDRNRERLREYFPMTSAALETPEAATTYITARLQSAQKKEGFFFAMVTGTDIIGSVIIKELNWRVPKCELAYFIDHAYEGKGIVSAAVKQVIAYCFDVLGMEKICIMLSPANTGSRRVAVSCGFVKEGHMRHEFRTGLGTLADVEYYGLSKT